MVQLIYTLAKIHCKIYIQFVTDSLYNDLIWVAPYNHGIKVFMGVRLLVFNGLL